MSYSELSKPQRYIVDTMKFYNTTLQHSKDINEFYLYIHFDDGRYNSKVNSRTVQSLINRDFLKLSYTQIYNIQHYSLNKDITYPVEHTTRKELQLLESKIKDKLKCL